MPSPREAPTGRLSTTDALVQLSFQIHAALQRHAAGQRLSMIQTRLLGILRDRTPTMQELATMIVLDKSSVTGLVDRAERRGLVARTPDSGDRRAVRVSITEAGRAQLAQVGAGFDAELAELLSGLTEVERETLVGLLSTMLTAHAAKHGVDLFATLDAPGASESQ